MPEETATSWCRSQSQELIIQYIGLPFTLAIATGQIL